MRISEVKSLVSSLLKRKGISLYDSFEARNIAVSKEVAFLYPPTLEKERKVLYPNGTHADFIRSYHLKLEIIGENIAPTLGSDLLKLIDNQDSFYEVKLSEVTISRVTSLPHFFVEFRIDEVSPETFIKNEKESVFNGFGVNAFVESFNLENDIFTPQVILADGTVYYGESVYRGRIYTLKIRFSATSKESFVNTVKTASDIGGEVKIDDETLIAVRILKAQLLSCDNYETTALLSFKTA